MVSTSNTDESDEQAIRNLKYQYCWAMDNNDVQELRTLFTADASMSAQKFSADEPHLDVTGFDELEEMMRERREEWDRTFSQHRVHNPVIRVDGDDATGNWYMTAINLFTDGRLEFEFGQYLETYRRVDDTWKIADFHVEFMELDPSLDDLRR
jgi:ketosteroid isomerase-like protein